MEKKDVTESVKENAKAPAPKPEKSEKEKKKMGLLIPQERYLEAGCHIGTKFKTGSMRPFIYRRRKDRLYVMDISKIDEQLRKAADFISKFDPEDIVITAVRTYASAAAAKMSLILGTKLIPKRFIPGTFTNPNMKYFLEPKLLFVCDPRAEAEAIREANMMKIPVVALCDTENDTRGIDVVIPCNNKGRRSLSLIFYLLTREYMMKRGMISSYSEFKYRPRDFEDLGAIQEYLEMEERRKTEIDNKSEPEQAEQAKQPEQSASEPTSTTSSTPEISQPSQNTQASQKEEKQSDKGN